VDGMNLHPMVHGFYLLSDDNIVTHELSSTYRLQGRVYYNIHQFAVYVGLLET